MCLVCNKLPQSLTTSSINCFGMRNKFVNYFKVDLIYGVSHLFQSSVINKKEMLL